MSKFSDFGICNLKQPLWAYFIKQTHKIKIRVLQTTKQYGTEMGLHRTTNNNDVQLPVMKATTKLN
jgi:hypothetical protein